MGVRGFQTFIRPTSRGCSKVLQINQPRGARRKLVNPVNIGKVYRAADPRRRTTLFCSRPSCAALSTTWPNRSRSEMLLSARSASPLKTAYVNSSLAPAAGRSRTRRKQNEPNPISGQYFPACLSSTWPRFSRLTSATTKSYSWEPAQPSPRHGPSARSNQHAPGRVDHPMQHLSTFRGPGLAE